MKTLEQRDSVLGFWKHTPQGTLNAVDGRFSFRAAETMVETTIVGIYRAILTKMWVSERWCITLSIHSSKNIHVDGPI